MDENDRIKRLALSLAVRLHGPNQVSTEETIETVLMYADELAFWLGNPVASLAIEPDLSTYKQGAGDFVPFITQFFGGKVELKDNQQVLMTLHPRDAKGFDAAEPEGTVLEWSSSDPAVLSLQPAADGMSCLAVAGNPGAALANVTDGFRSGSLAFDVTTGDVSAIEVEAGTPEDQPPAPGV